MLARKRPLRNRSSGFKKFGNFSPSAANDKYVWTAHSQVKMRQYGLSASRVKRIIQFPARYEEGIIPKAIAVMQPAGTQRYSEIWVMYKLVGEGRQANPKQRQKLKIITAWRYPGESPARSPVPKEVIEEVRKML
jgi:hypothetical protein